MRNVITTFSIFKKVNLDLRNLSLKAGKRSGYETLTLCSTSLFNNEKYTKREIEDAIAFANSENVGDRKISELMCVYQAFTLFRCGITL